MDRHEFANRLKILRSIDADELMAAGLEPEAWAAFRRDPTSWLIQADDDGADKLWALVERRTQK